MRRARGAAGLAAISGKRYWRETDARLVLEELQASGQALAPFCREHGLNEKRVMRWRSRLRRRATGMEMIRVEVVPESRKKVEVRGEVQVVLRNGRRLAIREAVDRELLAEVADAVEGWPC